jgi:trk system potassium uptake protein TrkH
MLFSAFADEKIFITHSVEVFIVLDLFVAILIYILGKEFRLIYILNLFSFWNKKKIVSNSLIATVSIVTDFLRAFALIFGLYWLLKWWQPYFDPLTFDTAGKAFSFLDSFIFTTLTVYFLNPTASIRFFKRIDFTSGRVVVTQFIAAVLFGALLLLLPVSTQTDQKLAVVDALFLSVSALSVTGLSPVDISIVLSKFGMIILLFLIQLGGLGVIVLSIGITTAVRRRLTINDMKLSQSAFENCVIGDTSSFLARVVAITFLIEAIGAAWIYFSLPAELTDRYFVAIFHSISAFCNAGFSTFSENLANSTIGTAGLFAICILIIFGGIGFPVIINIYDQFKRGKMSWSFLLPQTKLVLCMTFSLLLIGFFVFVFFHLCRPNFDLTVFEVIKQAAFYSVSSRTAGFNLIPVEQFSVSIQFLIILLMFVGASPSSTGGGVKTTTIGVIMASVRSTFLQDDQTFLFYRRIEPSIVQRSIAVCFLYIFTAGVALLILAVTENISFLSLVFETFSALSTVGLTMGTTSQLSIAGKIVVMFLMVFGRIGLISIVSAGVGSSRRGKIQFPKENFYVG